MAEAASPPDRRAAPWALGAAAAALVLLNIAARWPGENNPDAAHQYREIVAGPFDDWHPPLMARLWQALGVLGGGTGPIFAFNVLVYWAVFALFALGLWRRGWRIAAWVLLALGLAPPLLMMSVNVVKDVTLLLTLAGPALVFATRAGMQRDRPVLLVAATVVLIAGVLVRNSAVFLAGPLLLYLWWPAALRRTAVAAIGSVVLGLALVPVSGRVNHDVLGARAAGPIRSLQLFDLAGIAQQTGEPGVFGADSRITARDVDRCYTPIMWDTLGWDHRCGWFVRGMGVAPRFDLLVDNPADQAAMGRLGRLWREAIVAHPLAYAAHRLRHFNATTAFLVPWRHTAGEANLPPRKPGMAGRLLDLARYFPLFAPATVLAIAAGLVLALGGRRRPVLTEPTSAALALALAALLYGLSFLVVGVASDPRYFFVPTVAVGIAVVLTIAELWSGRERGEARRIAVIAGPLAAVVLALVIGSRLTLTPPAPRAKGEVQVVPDNAAAILPGLSAERP